MNYADNEHRLTRAELSLGDTVTAQEWRDIYQPNGFLFRNYPLPKRKPAEKPELNSAEGAQ